MLRYASLLALLLASPLRAEPAPSPAPRAAGPCLASAMILVRTAQPHVDELKAQVKQFLARTTGSVGVDSGGKTQFAFDPPRHGLVALDYMPDALGVLIFPRRTCADPAAASDADDLAYMRSLHDELQRMRLIVSDLMFINLREALESAKP